MIVSCCIRDPSKAVFFKTKNDHAECKRIDCSLHECPLREKGQCAKIAVLGVGACPYGHIFFEKGPTKKARGFVSWIEKRKEEYKGIPTLKYPANKIAFIGDYVYLPYSHMDMNKGVPFLEHSSLFVSGKPFVKKDFWTLDTVLKIITFRPMALMGGEITSYQKESVPLFLEHLREEDKGMWEELIKVSPNLDKPPVYIGRKALLHTLNFPIEWTEENSKYGYPVTWKWDGKVLTTDSKHIYSPTWGGSIVLESLCLTGVPKSDTVIDVRENSWVNDKTEFTN
jgi:hypothetical protein